MTTTTLVTGCAGFIGFHVCRTLLDRGDKVVGLDDLNDYYPVSLKHARLDQLKGRDGFRFIHSGLCDYFQSPTPMAGIDKVIHLAARAGVRNSTDFPAVYGHANVMGTLHLFEAARRAGVKEITYASSSSAKRIASVYGATKRACDDLAEAFASLHGLAITGLRFHTVYGPWGRPDMAIWKFTRAAFQGDTVELYNGGRMDRDFTFIGDIVRGTVAAHDRPGHPGMARVVDLGRGSSRELLRVVELIEQSSGRPLRRSEAPMQLGDVETTLADNGPAREAFGYDPVVHLEDGIPEFVAWYREHRKAGGCP